MGNIVEHIEPTGHLRRPVESPADAIDRSGRIDALIAWLGDIRDPIRADLARKLRAVEEISGGDPKVTVRGLGQAYMTQPEPKARVSDVERFALWAQYEKPRGITVGRTERAVIPDEHQGAVLAALKDGDREVVGAFLRVETQYHLGENTDKVLNDEGGWFDPVEVCGGWVLVYRETGEDVPGVSVSCGTPQLTVKVDPAAKKRLRAELDELIGPAQLGGEEQSNG